MGSRRGNCTVPDALPPRLRPVALSRQTSIPSQEIGWEESSPFVPDRLSSPQDPVSGASMFCFRNALYSFLCSRPLWYAPSRVLSVVLSFHIYLN